MNRIILLSAVVAFMATVPASAHHSFAAEFDYDLTGTIEGEVVEALFVNPHARFFIAVLDEDGNEEIWDAQTLSTSALTRAGWTRDLIKVGDHVVFEGNLSNNNSHKLWIRRVTLASGQVIRPLAGRND